MNELLEPVKRIIDDMFIDIKQTAVDTPGFTYDTVLFHKDGKPLFTMGYNIMTMVDAELLPTSSNLMYYGFEQNEDMKEYFKHKVLDETGLEPDIVTIMPSWKEKQVLQVLSSEGFGY